MRLRSYLRGLGAGIFASAVLMGIATSSTKGGMTDEEVKQRAAQLGMVEEEAVLVKPKTEEKTEEINVSAPKVSEPEDKQKAEPEKEQEKKDPEAEKKENGNKEENNKKDKSEENADAVVKDTEADGNEKVKENNAQAPDNEDLAMGGNSGGDANNDPGNESDKKETADVKKDDDTEAENNASGGSYTLQIAAGSSSYTVANLLMKGGVIDDADDFDKYLCDNGYDHRINHGVFKIPAGADYEQIARMITGNK
ncbi:MAG: hypothetical protein K6E63_02960 [Lachnospiraceae bacterium]|nr:hypothetical protein [Lachnospiraceae bacterium]